MFALWQRETEVRTKHSPDLPRHCLEPPAPTRGCRLPKGRAALPKLRLHPAGHCGAARRWRKRVGRGEATGWWQLPGPGAAAGAGGGPERGRSGAGAVRAALRSLQQPRAGEQRAPLGHRAAGRAGEQRRHPASREARARGKDSQMSVCRGRNICSSDIPSPPRLALHPGFPLASLRRSPKEAGSSHGVTAAR